ncbi:nitrate/nitrite transporter [Capillimicrobium parvum]|uniref:Nitrate/nitrite transporter NarK2 n=1 Tax=Capillimicrobium parvum TaxID=2884022 RepID=A0A9E7C0N1_9ACTN|nr:MFS transporter [Capillimicrobium parvum]UGS36556.1 putative nitrate/nitrite transporter NarK2 [Capillimicrobium parvum]
MSTAPQERAGSAGTELALATLAFAVCFYAWSLLGPLAPDIQDDLGLSDFQSSVMVAVPVLLGSLMRIPLGWLTDRAGGRRVFTALMAFTPLPLIALALWHDSLTPIIVFGFLLGFAGASFAVGVPFVNGWYPPERQGSALGIYGAGMGGTVVAGLTAPRIADAWGLAAPFWVATGLVIVIAFVFYALARDAPRAARTGPAPGMFGALSVFRSSGRAWALTLFYFMAFGGFVAMFLYLPKLLTGVHDLSKSDAGARAAGFALLAVIARPLGGWLADRIGAARVLLASFISVTGLALLLAASYKHIVPLTIVCLVMAVFLGLGTGAVFKLVPEWFPDRVGAVTGVVGAAGGLGGFFPPLVMGIVKSATGGYGLGFVLMALVSAACLVVLAAVRPRTAHAPVKAPG